MKKEDLQKAKRELKILVDKDFVKAIFIFGSSIKKKKLTDVDILIFIDETCKESSKKMQHLLQKTKVVEEKSKLNFHFQKPVPIGFLWSVLIKGEPWIITAMKNPISIYDPLDYLHLIKKIIKKKKHIGKEIKSERLISRAQDWITDNRELMLSLIEEIFLATFEASQIFLLMKEKIIYEPRKILKELEKEGINTDTFSEILDFHEKTNKGALSEFTGENLDYYLDKAKKFISELKIISKEK